MNTESQNKQSPSKTFKILFVCTGNTCRSPMAEGALKVLLRDDQLENVEVTSAGVGASVGFPATRFAQEAASMWHADLSAHKSRQLTREMVDESDLILAMTPGHYNAILQVAPGVYDKLYLFKGFPNRGDSAPGVVDPIGMTLDVYNEVFEEIGDHLKRIFPEIRSMIKERSRA